MEFYDLCLRTKDSQTIKMAKKLGFSGVGIILDFEKGILQEVNTLRKNHKNAAFGVKLKTIKNARDIRKNIELLAANDREALETKEIDLAFCDEVNYIMAKLAKRNNVAIVFSLNPILYSSKRKRGEILASYFNTAKLVRKYNSPFILTSGALSEWDVRSPSDLIAFGKVLGFTEKQCKKALSGSILKQNLKRLDKKWIQPGVELV